ncbi:MAG: hypothetical protein JNK41_01100, partial [Saprospiraceae bacterium]|nr:hypothetical protein [Saprospiraceae bacterium]
QEIGLSMLSAGNYSISDEASSLLFEKIQKMHLYRDKYFGNARTIRQMIQELIKIQNLRLANHAKDDLKEMDSNHISLADVQELQMLGVTDIFEKKGIGFK